MEGGLQIMKKIMIIILLMLLSSSTCFAAEDDVERPMFVHESSYELLNDCEPLVIESCKNN